MEPHQEKIKSEVDSIIDSLLSPTPGTSCADATQRISAISTDYLRACAQRFVESSEGADGAEDSYRANGTTTPGLPGFFWILWDTVIERVSDAPVEGRAHDEHITRLVDLVDKTKGNPQSESDWSIGGEKLTWKDLPLLGHGIRDAYYDPFDTITFKPSSLLAPEGQAAVAGASKLEPQDSSGESTVSQLVKARHRWLSLQSFISRLWRDCARNEYASYAIWALRPALEDWPESPPSCDAKCDTFEESPAFLAFQVEAAAIWICNTAPLMYKCTEIWGPNGNPEWPKMAGAPGRGGRRWKGVDGYDREHKRWRLWKDVLGEVIQWCDRAGNEQIQEWKVRDAAIRALDAMKAAEQQ